MFHQLGKIITLLDTSIAQEKKIMATLDQLNAAFTAFQTDFTGFVTNVQAALAKLAAGGLTTDQQAEVDSITTGLTAMDSTVKGITFPAA